MILWPLWEPALSDLRGWQCARQAPGTHAWADDCGSRMISDFEKININKYIPSTLLGE